MQKKKETSPEVASKASKVLKDKTASKEAKSIAASALAQAPDEVVDPVEEVTEAVEVESSVPEWLPSVGEKCWVRRVNGVGFIGEVRSFDPFVLIQHSIVGGCQNEQDVTEYCGTNISFESMTREEAFRLLSQA